MVLEQGEQNSNLSDIVNYFIQGFIIFGFSYIVSLMYFLAPIWLVFLPFNILFVSALVLITGMINMILCEYVWSLRSNGNVENWFIQGVIISIPTQIWMIPFHQLLVGITLQTVPIPIITLLTTFCVSFLVFGYIGKTVGQKYVEPEVTSLKTTMKTRPRFRGTRGRCPHCGESFKYPSHDISPANTVRCLNCKKEFYLEPDDSLLRKFEHPEGSID